MLNYFFYYSVISLNRKYKEILKFLAFKSGHVSRDVCHLKDPGVIFGPVWR